MICSRKICQRYKYIECLAKIKGGNVPKTLSKRENMPKMLPRGRNVLNMLSRGQNVPNLLSRGGEFAKDTP